MTSDNCGIDYCSGPSNVSCAWSDPPPVPTNTPVPTDIPPTNTPVPTDTPEPTVPACSGCTLPNTLTLVSPANGSTIGITRPLFSWTLGSWGFIPDGCTLGSYLIKIANNPGFSPNEVDESGLCSTTHPLSCSYTPVSPLALGTHYYRIYAFTGCGSIMQEASFTIAAATPTPTPTMGLPVFNTQNCNSPASGQVNLSWSRADNATSYELRVDNQTANGWKCSDYPSDPNCCSSPYSGDVCTSIADPTNTYTFTYISGNTYNTWMSAWRPPNDWGPGVQGPIFSCVPSSPTLTPTSVLSPTPSITLTPSPTLIPSPTPTAGPWEKLSRGSYHSKEYYRLVNPIPQVVSAYDSDDSTTPYFVIDKPGVTGEAGVVSGRTIDITPASRVSHNFWSKSSYQSKPGFTHETFLKYVNSKKASQTITDPADIAEDDGIYKMSAATLTDKAVFGSSNFVLIVSGTVNINLSSPNTDFSPTGSMAILADTINFNSNVTTAKGIFIANTINIAEVDDKGIKITGNLIALDSFVNGRNWDSTNNTKPSLFVVFDPKQYLDLLPYLSISKYDWKEMQ